MSLRSSQLYDEDCFVYFLYARNLCVKRLGLCLADLKQRVIPDAVSKLNLPEGAVTTKPHSNRRVSSLVSSTFMNVEQVTWLLRHIVPPSNDHSGDLHGESVHEVRRHVYFMAETRENMFVDMKGPVHDLADGSYAIKSYTMCPIFTFLKMLVDEFAQTAEAIVKELKFNDDGYRLTMLNLLQETVQDEDRLKLTAEKVIDSESQSLYFTI